MMSEPKLSDISDYNTLKGEKKRVVWAVIIAGIIISVVYTAVYYNFGKVEGSIKINDPIKNIPIK